MCERSALSGFWVHSTFSISEAWVLSDLANKSTKKLLVEPPTMVELFSCLHDVCYVSQHTHAGANLDQLCGQLDCVSFNSSAFEDVDHESLWLAFVKEVRQPAECASLQTPAFL